MRYAQKRRKTPNKNLSDTLFKIVHRILLIYHIPVQLGRDMFFIMFHFQRCTVVFVTIKNIAYYRLLTVDEFDRAA